MSIIKAADIRLKVRPVLLGLEHKYFYEGPCRFGMGEALQPGYDRLANAQKVQQFLGKVRECAEAALRAGAYTCACEETNDPLLAVHMEAR